MDGGQGSHGVRCGGGEGEGGVTLCGSGGGVTTHTSGTEI